MSHGGAQDLVAQASQRELDLLFITCITQFLRNASRVPSRYEIPK
jgi:hypothetical protein